MRNIRGLIYSQLNNAAVAYRVSSWKAQGLVGDTHTYEQLPFLVSHNSFRHAVFRCCSFYNYAYIITKAFKEIYTTEKEYRDHFAKETPPYDVFEPIYKIFAVEKYNRPDDCERRLSEDLSYLKWYERMRTAAFFQLFFVSIWKRKVKNEEVIEEAVT